MNNLIKDLTLIQAVNSLLEKSEVPAALTIEECSSLLAMSMTSFRRKLSQEETSYKLIQTKFLNELCVQNLLTKHIKIDDLAFKLGYSERATFERAFRQKFGVTPSQFRILSFVNSKNECHRNLIEIAKNMPPMSNSCRQLLEEKDQEGLDLQRVVNIINNDAIFSARIMGLASRAIYGRTPKNISEAISRNLGIVPVINLAVIYAMKESLQNNVDTYIIEQYSEALVVAPKFFQLVRKSLASDIHFDIALTEQLLAFALLGIFLLSHKKAYKHELMEYSLKGIDDLQSLNSHVKETMDVSIFAASSLMLSLWHIDANIVKYLNHLDKISQAKIKGSEEDELILFMLSCLYFYASGRSDFSGLKQKAELMNIENLPEIANKLFNCEQVYN